MNLSNSLHGGRKKRGGKKKGGVERGHSYFIEKKREGEKKRKKNCRA